MNFVGLQQTISQGEHCDQDPSKHSDTITKYKRSTSKYSILLYSYTELWFNVVNKSACRQANNAPTRDSDTAWNGILPVFLFPCILNKFSCTITLWPKISLVIMSKNRFGSQISSKKGRILIFKHTRASYFRRRSLINVRRTQEGYSYCLIWENNSSKDSSTPFFWEESFFGEIN